MVAIVSRMKKLMSVSVVPENTRYGKRRESHHDHDGPARPSTGVGRRDRVTRTGSAAPARPRGARVTLAHSVTRRR